MKIPAHSAAVVVAVLFSQAARAIPPEKIRPERELFITHPSVMDDTRAKYPGPWSFGGLIQEMAGEEKSGECIIAWLETWVFGQTVNGSTVPPRPGIIEKVIVPWQKRDGFDPKSMKPWVPKIENAPFRLLAIVNRMDLCASGVADTFGREREQWKAAGKEPLFDALVERATRSTQFADGMARKKITVPVLTALDVASFDTRSPGVGRPQSRGFGPYGAPQGDQFGEGRFIFGAVGENGQPLPGNWTVIFEYRLLDRNVDRKAAGKSPVSEWANRWHSLTFLDPGTAAYAEQLEKVTRSFTHSVPRGAANVSVGQVRTSEAAFGPGREFRQFKLSDGKLVPEPLAQTPAPEFGKKDGPETRLLAEFLREGSLLVRSGIHAVPLTFQARNELVPVMGGSAIIPADKPDFRWDVQHRVDRTVRRVFSLNTCTGCHAGETACTTGLHVSPRAEGASAVLSEFLRMDGRSLHTFDKIASQKIEFHEMNERAEIFSALLDTNDTRRMENLRTVLRERLGRSH